MIDISSPTNLSLQGFVQAIIDIIRQICERELQRGTGRFPFVFFEEADLDISQNTIRYIVTRSRHLGITCFFVTNMVSGPDETVLRHVANIFLLYLPFDDYVRHISKSAMVDQEVMGWFVKRLRRHHALILGDVTRHYPVIIKAKTLKASIRREKINNSSNRNTSDAARSSTVPESVVLQALQENTREVGHNGARPTSRYYR